jgi:hypothetical protein
MPEKEERIAMANRFMLLCAALLIFVAPRPALADASAGTVYDTVDGVELDQVEICVFGCVTHTIVKVTGIRTGHSTPSTLSFDFVDKADIAAHCQRLAMLAMSKPGKYQFGIGADGTPSSAATAGHGACSLTLVNP